MENAMKLAELAMSRASLESGIISALRVRNYAWVDQARKDSDSIGEEMHKLRLVVSDSDLRLARELTNAPI